MCTLHDFISSKDNLFIRALLLDRISVTEKTTRTPRVHLVMYVMLFEFTFILFFYIVFLNNHVLPYIPLLTGHLAMRSAMTKSL